MPNGMHVLIQGDIYYGRLFAKTDSRSSKSRY